MWQFSCYLHGSNKWLNYYLFWPSASQRCSTLLLCVIHDAAVSSFLSRSNAIHVVEQNWLKPDNSQADNNIRKWPTDGNFLKINFIYWHQGKYITTNMFFQAVGKCDRICCRQMWLLPVYQSFMLRYTMWMSMWLFFNRRCDQEILNQFEYGEWIKIKQMYCNRHFSVESHIKTGKKITNIWKCKRLNRYQYMLCVNSMSL